MIDSWQEAGAVVGAFAIITGAIMKVFSSNSKRDGEVLDALLKNQSDQTRILDKLSMLIEHRDIRTEELHKDTHKKIEDATRMQSDKLDEVTGNQREIIAAIKGFGGINGMRLT